jgi:hypothetical protein
MFARKSPPDLAADHPYRKQLQLLYERRSAIDALIRSLADYERLRTRTLEAFKEKTV